MNIQNSFMPVFCMDEEGGGEGDGGGGGEPAGGATDDGTGGKAGMFQSGGEEGGQDDQQSDQGGGDGQVDLKALLGEELSGNENIAKFLNTENPVQEMAKSMLEAQKQIGKPKVGVPGENATPEERAAFNEALGVPKDAAGYEFTKPEEMPDEMYNAEHAEKWASLLHKHNVPKDAALALRDAMYEESIEQETAANEALNEVMSKHFGDDAGLLAKQAGALMQQAIPDDGLRATIQAAIGNENTPAFAAALGFAVQYMKKTYGLSDENLGDSGGSSGMSSADLRAEAQKLMASDAYRDAMHKDHDSTKSKVNDLYKQVGSAIDAENARKR